MYLTKDGGLIIGGYSGSGMSNQKTENSRGAADYWIVKLDSSSIIRWDKTIGGNSSDLLFVIQQTTDSGYILGGYSSSGKSGEKTESSRGDDDYWIVKLNAQGAIEWDKTIGGNTYDILQSVQQTTDGGYIVGGQSLSNKSGEKTENGRGSYDYWIVSLGCRWQYSMG